MSRSKQLTLIKGWVVERLKSRRFAQSHVKAKRWLSHLSIRTDGSVTRGKAVRYKCEVVETGR